MAEDFLTRQRYDGDLNDILGFEELALFRRFSFSALSTTKCIRRILWIAMIIL